MDRNTFSPNTVQTSQIGDKPIVRKGYICGFQSKRYKKKNGIVLERAPDATWTNEEGCKVSVHHGQGCCRIQAVRERYQNEKKLSYQHSKLHSPH